MSPARIASKFASRQFLLYVTGGVLSALVDIGLLQLLLQAGVHYTAAASAGFAAGLLVNFAFHSGVTFSASANPGSLARYLCLVGLNYLLTLGCVALAQATLGNPLAGKLLSLPLVTVNGFLLGKYWIFK